MTDLIGSITAAREAAGEAPAAPDVSTFDLLRRAAKSLRAGASWLEVIVRVRGDDPDAPKLSATARSRRELADQYDRRAGEIGPPSKALMAWDRGQREASRFYNPPAKVPKG